MAETEIHKTALYLSTEDFNRILEGLKSSGWKITAEYLNLADKGIDFDFYVLQRRNEEILMAWDNWTEGAVKADEKYLAMLEKKLGKTFRYGRVKYFEEDLPNIKKRLFKYFWRQKLTWKNVLKFAAVLALIAFVVYFLSL